MQINPSRQQCEEWARNPLVNPISKKAIQRDKSIYNEIKKKCLVYDHVHSNLVPAVLQCSYVTSSYVTRKDHKHNNNDNNNNKNDEYTSTSVLTPRRKATVASITDPQVASSVRQAYGKLNICTAPHNININYKQYLQKYSRFVYQTLTETLYLIYGDTIIPGKWEISIDGGSCTRSKLYLVINNAIESTFHDVVHLARNTKRPHCLLLSVPNDKSNDAKWHAMMLAFYTKHDHLHVCIVDPLVERSQDAFTINAIKFLNRNATKTIGFQDRF